ncbi:hypothetical protein NVIE_2542 [Nitrososphaera viennensis EN76]|uniref:Uncharacterized protein n=1 Tax=Nitrososphaera viennensis EN76 TaxID=926571 RepID=A0A060HUH3_9ARCH|nr:hypothetical protein NVIE_2542 [Nitrososphaera viennensis EN76]
MPLSLSFWLASRLLLLIYERGMRGFQLKQFTLQSLYSKTAKMWVSASDLQKHREIR